MLDKSRLGVETKAIGRDREPADPRPALTCSNCGVIERLNTMIRPPVCPICGRELTVELAKE